MFRKITLTDTLIVTALAGTTSFRFFAGFNTLYDILVGITIVSILFSLIKKTSIMFNKKYLFTLSLLVFYIVLSYFYTYNQSYMIERFLTIFQLMIFAIIVMLYIINNNKVGSLPYYLMYSGVLALAFIYLHVEDIVESRVGGSIVGTNGLAYLLLFSLVSAIYLYMNQKNFIYFIISFFLISNIVLTGSRQALITILFLLVVFLVKKVSTKGTGKIFFKKAINFLFVVLIGIVIVINFYEFIPERIINMFSFENLNLTGRDTLIKYGLQGFLDKPLFGHGFMSYNYFIERNYNIDVGYSHNNYVELLFSLGLFGFLIYYLPYIYILKKALNKAKTIYSENSNILNLLYIYILIILVEDLFTSGLKFSVQYLIVGITIFTLSYKGITRGEI